MSKGKNAVFSGDSDKVVFRVNGLWISYAHTACAGAAFASALVVGCLLHLHKIVQNEFYGYPDEWFPSVSATIGDRYPERSFYQLLIALTAGPRFLMVLFSYIFSARDGSWLPKAMLLVGVVRTFTCGGWTYITSTDDHGWHDIFMISYMVLTVPWTLLRIYLSKPASRARRYRIILASLFYGTIVPLVYFFIQHKVKQVPGAYTIYAFFEWSLIIFDVGFDAGTAYEFADLDVVVVARNNAVQHDSTIEVLRNPQALSHGPSYIHFFISTINYFISWSVITSLGVTTWYFPLWYMGISGYEVALLSVTASALLFGPIRKLLYSCPQLAFLGQAVGVGSYWVSDPRHRLLWIALGCASSSVALATSLCKAAHREGGVASESGAFICGLMLSVAAKITRWSNNPIWPIMHAANGGVNPWGLAIAIVAGVCAGFGDKVKCTESKNPIAGPRESSVVAGAALGALVFLLETLLSDSGFLQTWTWDGYPVRGPLPMPHGIITIFGMAVGIYIGVTRSSCATKVLPMAVATSACAVFLVSKHWLGYIGGLLVGTYLCAITPSIFEAAARHHPSKSFGTGSLVYVLLVLAETWTVAYAFVPGGFLLRERLVHVLAAAQLLVLVGVLHTKRAIGQANVLRRSKSLRKVAKSLFSGLAVILVLSTCATYFRVHNAVAPKPRHPEEKLLTAGIWTIHFGLDNDMWSSEVRMGQLVDELDIDVVGLLETDTQRKIGGHRDLTQRLAEEFGFYADYGPGPNKHTWGAALLSRFPILNSTHHLLPSPVGELAPAIHATIDAYGQLVDVFVFHSGQEEDIEDRRLQSLALANLMGRTNRPTILLSYLVTKPKEGNYNTYVSKTSGMHDIDPSDWDRWCEYILYKNLKRVGYARVSRSTITDTELQVGKFVVGAPADYSNTPLEEAEVPPGMRFPALFRGNGVRGHRYHVFDEPRYYL